MDKGIVYYTDNQLDEPLFSLVQERLNKTKLPIISISLKPIEFGENIHYNGKRSYMTMFKQILEGLKASEANYIFMCEHDVLYDSSHFDFIPEKDKYYYNNNVRKFNLNTGECVSYDCMWLSQLCASRKMLLEHYKKKIDIIEKTGKLWKYRFEPGTKKGIDNYKTEWFYSKKPNIDIKHGRNLMGTSRFKPEDFKDKNTCKNFKEYTLDQINGWDTKLLWNLANT